MSKDKDSSASYATLHTVCMAPVSLISAKSTARDAHRLMFVYLGNVESLDVADTVQSEVPRERHGQVVAQGQELATLIRQVVDELRVLAVLPCKRL